MTFWSLQKPSRSMPCEVWGGVHILKKTPFFFNVQKDLRPPQGAPSHILTLGQGGHNRFKPLSPFGNKRFGSDTF